MLGNLIGENLRYINFFGIAFCLLLNVFTFYSSESKKADDCDNSYHTSLAICSDNPFRQETDRVRDIHFLFKDGCTNRQLAKNTFYRCFASPKHNQEVIEALYPYLKPPFPTDFLSKLKGKPVPMKILAAKKNIAISIDPDEDIPDWKILTKIDMYRDDNDGSFTLTKASQFINKVAFPTLLPTLEDLSYESAVPSKPLSFPKSSNPWRNPLAWTCISPLSETERLAIVHFFLGKGVVDNATIRQALGTCQRNEKYNSSIIKIMQQELAMNIKQQSIAQIYGPESSE